MKIFTEITNKTTTMAKQNSHMSLSIYHQNLRQLKHKIDELACSLIAKELHPYFTCTTKHYLIEQKLLLINHENYHLVSNFSRIKNTSGVCIYVRSETITNTVAKKVSQFCKEKIFEAYAVQIIVVKFSIRILCIYRSPSGDFDQFLIYVISLWNIDKEFVICGDFNINFFKDSIFKQQITLLF